MLPSMCCGRWPKLGEKLDGEQIEESFDESAHAILGLAEAARPMIDRDFADAEAARRGQHRDEAVQFAVEPHLAKHLGAIALHAAIVVVQFHAGEPADQPVEDAAGQDFVPGIVADVASSR